MGKNNERLRIDGVKFHQGHLDLLKAEHECSPLYASEIAMFIVSLFYCDDLGTIRLSGKESVVKKGADRTGIPYNTLHTGFSRLLERKLIVEEIENNRPVYVIKDYAALNSPMSRNYALLSNPVYSKGHSVSLNYFYIPEYLLNAETQPLKQLVTARDAKGLIVLLDLFNSFSRDLRFNPTDLNFSVKRKMEWFKKVLNRNAKKVRVWLDHVEGIFTATITNEKKRFPKNIFKMNKKENPTQRVIEAFELSLNTRCLYTETEETSKVQLRAAVRKDITHQIKHLDVNYDFTAKDINDLVYTYEQLAIETLNHVPVKQEQKKNYLMYVLGETLHSIKTFYTKNIEKNSSYKIESLGALFRTFLKPKINEFVSRDLPQFERVTLLDKVKDNPHRYPAIEKFLTTSKYILG